MIKNLTQLKVEDQRVFLRLDLNVPMDSQGHITDDRRIQEAIPTIKYLLEKKARIIIGAHLGRPKGTFQEKLSMKPVGERLAELLEKEVLLVDEVDSDAPKALFLGLKSNKILLLENLRFHKDEVLNETSLANSIKSYTDVYVNDAFGSSHREHTSLHALPRLYTERGMGLLIQKELHSLEALFNEPAKPFYIVMGGAKIAQKIPTIEQLMSHADGFIIGGAMAYTFLKARGEKVGKSLVEKSQLRYVTELMNRLHAKGKTLLLPEDHIVSKDFSGQLGAHVTRKIADDELALDIGPGTIEKYTSQLKEAKTVLWNGPMGVFENPKFARGTQAVCQAISENTGFTVVGGGDSAAAALKFEGEFSHVSTGGGACLEYLEKRSLPGVDILKPTKKEIAGQQRVEWVSEEYQDLEDEFPQNEDRAERTFTRKDS